MTFGSANLNRGYWPFKGLFISLLSHSSILVGTTLLAILSTPVPPRLITRQVMIDLRDPEETIVLPTLADSGAPEEPTVDQPPIPKGASFPGPRRIRSDVQEPTNQVQTLLQPSVPNPPILELPVVLPNMVSMAIPRPIHTLDSLTPPAPLVTEPPPFVPQAIEAPKIQTLNVAPKSIAVQDRDLLALTALPPPPQPPVVIPAGEARASFAVSPEPNSAPPAAAPGSKSPTDSTAAGKSPFSGITVIGGVLETPKTSAPASDNAAPAPFQTAWGATIQSTEDNGGGLPRFGVFSGEIHTAYLDMRRTVADQPHDWIFEFGAPAEAETTANGARPWRKFVLPFPTIREQPVLPAELVRKYSRRMIVIYAVISIDGKMEEMSVKDSPDPLLNTPVLSALSKWIFKPAQTDGKIVAVKMLVGIPLS